MQCLFKVQNFFLAERFLAMSTVESQNTDSCKNVVVQCTEI